MLYVFSEMKGFIELLMLKDFHSKGHRVNLRWVFV